jgi:RNA polymerase sigma-70 factor (ECF subfamily)
VSYIREFHDAMPTLSQNELIRTLLAQRPRMSVGIWLLVHDVHLAEDVFQELMVKALENQALFTNEAQLLSWCRITARNLSLNLLRRRQRETTMLSEQVVELLEQEWEAQGASVAARIDALQDCLEALPEPARVLLDLRYFQGRSCTDVGKVLGMRLEAAYQRLSRLHRALRECVEGRLQGSAATAEGAS